eukprot:jgi/Chlat1/7903/Chrsp66S07201
MEAGRSGASAADNSETSAAEAAASSREDRLSADSVSGEAAQASTSSSDQQGSEQPGPEDDGGADEDEGFEGLILEEFVHGAQDGDEDGDDDEYEDADEDAGDEEDEDDFHDAEHQPQEPTSPEEIALQRGKMQHGCTHYRRRCRIRAPCCDEVFSCRHCHNELKNAGEKDPAMRHEMDRKAVTFVVCCLCETEQEVAQVCSNCGVRMGEYFCAECKFYDDEVRKKQFHCNKCGICRVGGQANFFHCDTCGCCYTMQLQARHVCVEKSMHHNCPVCFEYLFDSIRPTAVLPCGHTIHQECQVQLQQHHQYTCPICSKSTQDMSATWRHMDLQVAAVQMPEEYRDKKVSVLCNDCGKIGETNFHVMGLKCHGCNSYNTRQIK